MLFRGPVAYVKPILSQKAVIGNGKLRGHAVRSRGQVYFESHNYKNPVKYLGQPSAS